MREHGLFLRHHFYASEFDQILAGKAWTPSHRELGPDYGSDHLPVYSEFMSADRDCANAGSSKALATQH